MRERKHRAFASPRSTFIEAHPVQSTHFLSHLKTLESQKPSLLYNLLNLQVNTFNRSSTAITRRRPPVNSRHKITDRSFTYQAPALWDSLPKDLRYPLSQTSSTNLSHSTNHLLALSASQFLSLKLKTHLFHRLFPALVLLAPLHRPIVGSLVLWTWLHSHFASLSLSL